MADKRVRLTHTDWDHIQTGLIELIVDLENDIDNDIPEAPRRLAEAEAAKRKVDKMWVRTYPKRGD